MRFQLRLVAALWVASLLVIGVFAYLQVVEERQRLIGELDRRAALIRRASRRCWTRRWPAGATRPQIDRLIKKFSKPDLDLAVFDRVASLISVTPNVGKQIETPPPEVTWALTSGAVQTGFRTLDGKTLYVYADPILRDDKATGALVVFLDASDLRVAEWERWRFNAVRFLVLAAVLAVMALLVVRMSLTQPLAKMARWTKAVRRGHAIDPPEMPDESLFGPIAREVSVLAKNLQRARAAAEEEAALRLIGQTLWTEERLKQFAKMRLGERPLVVVSNREPISHVWKDGRIQVITPASGLVTAMDPVMRACGGIWVAQASGDADRETADPRGRLRVPPDDPRFTLKRVWLTPEEEQGYYYGFSNEGLWPLCHIVHNRPLFRPEDWAHYRAVNEKFAAAVLEEIAGTESPMVLIQDYHFALLPGAHQARAPGRAHRDLLAHPVAELRGLLDLPVAGRAAPGHAGRRPHRLPHPVLLQQLPGHGGAGDRGAHRLGAFLGHPRAARDLGEAVPDQRGPRLRGQPARRRPGRRCSRASTPPPSSSESGWSGSTTPRACPSGSGRWAASSSASRSTASAWSSCSSRRRAAAPFRATRRWRPRWTRRSRR